MKILAPYAYFAPERAASSYLWQNLHETFASCGWDCDVYVPTPTRGIVPEVRIDYRNGKKIESFYDGKLMVRHFSLWSEPKGAAMRFVRYFVQCIRQYFLVFNKKGEYDVIFAASTPPIIGVTCAMIKKRLQIPFVYNLQDIFPDSLLGASITKKKGLAWKIGRKLEDLTYKHADKIIVISEDFKRNIMAKGVPEEKIEVVYNWVDENAVVPVSDAENPLFEEFGISRNKFRVVYAGNLGNAQNIDIILDAAKRLLNEFDIEFVIFGSGGRETEIRTRIENGKLTNVKLLPLQPYDRVSFVYGLGNVCIVSCKAGLGGSAMPSKTWSIMSSGRAVLANFDEGELKLILEKNDCGLFTMSGDVGGFVSAILSLSHDISLCARMGKNGRKFILDNLTKEVGTRRYVEVIRGVVNESYSGH